MKKRVSTILTITALSALFFSCSDMKELKKADEEDTLRALSETLSQEIPWTSQIEADRLTRNIKTSDGILKSIALTPVIVISSGDREQENPVYPYLEGFGSLDVSDIPLPIRSVLDSFCLSLSKDTDADSYMSKKGLYSLALFYKDLSESASEFSDSHAEAEKTAEPKAAKSEKKDEKAPAGKDGGLAPAEAEDGEEVQKKVFDQWIIGEPFVTASSFEIPVRFVAKSYSCDVYLFFIKEEASWKIDQIQIHKWGEGNGGK